MTVKYHEYNKSGELVPVLEENAQKSGRFIWVKGQMVRVGDAKKGPAHYAGSDDLGLQGIQNPVDGKMYDSRSAYYSAVKDAGCAIVGNDAPTQKSNEIKGNFDCKEAIKSAAHETGFL